MRKGFTLVELLVVIGIIAIMAAILFPVFSSIRNKSYQADCLSNLRQIAQGVLAYRVDYEDWPTTHWTPRAYTLVNDVLVPQAVGGKDQKMLECRTGAKYGFNYRLTPNFRLNQRAEWLEKNVGESESEVVMLSETPDGHIIVDHGKFGRAGIHFGGYNVAFADGSAKWVTGNKMALSAKFVLAGLVPSQIMTR